MQGELDWVLLKALEKDRTRRYETANGLARDIQRYLADEVVEARPPSAGYRLRKFVRRHKGQVLAASLVLLALLAGMAGTTWGLIEAKKQEQEAKRQEAAANSYADEANVQARVAGDNARKAETEARLARKAEQEARDRAIARPPRKALAQKETQLAEAEWSCGERAAGAGGMAGLCRKDPSGAARLRGRQRHVCLAISQRVSAEAARLGASPPLVTLQRQTDLEGTHGACGQRGVEPLMAHALSAAAMTRQRGCGTPRRASNFSSPRRLQTR